MARDIEALTAPLSDEENGAAGPDLGYSNDRSTIEAPFQLDANGESVEERAWRDSIRLIDEQAEQTRDLWLATYLTRSGAKVGDLQIVDDGARMLAGLLENLWESVHPTLEEADFIGRKTPCDSLTKIREFLTPLKRVTVFEHRMGKVTGEDLERFASEGGGADGYAQFRGAIETSDPERAEEIKQAFADTIAKLDSIRDSLQRVDKVLVANAGSDTGTNFAPTYEALATIRAAALPFAGLDEPDDDGGRDEYASDSSSSEGGSTGQPSLSGRVNNREDVVRAIDAITEYYKAREPSSPVPVLLRRARHWVTMEFMDLLDDLVPDSVDSARRVLVSKIDKPVDDSGY